MKTSHNSLRILGVILFIGGFVGFWAVYGSMPEFISQTATLNDVFYISVAGFVASGVILVVGMMFIATSSILEVVYEYMVEPCSCEDQEITPETEEG